MKSILQQHKGMFIFLSLSILVALLFSLSFPATTLYDIEANLMERIRWFFDMVMAILYMTAGVTYFRTLQRTGNLWKLWRYIGFMMLFIGFSQIQIPILAYVGFSHSWFTDGVFGIFYLIAIIAAIKGARAYVKSIRKESLLISIPGVIVTAIIALVVVLTAYYVLQPAKTFGFNNLIALSIIYALYLLVAIVFWQFKNSIQGYLQSSFRLLETGFFLFVLAEAHSIYIVFTGDMTDSLISRIGTNPVLLIIPGAILLWASLTLRQKIDQFDQLQLNPADVSNAQATKPLNMITHEEPYKEISQEIIQKHMTLLGKNITISYAQHVDGIEVSESGDVINAQPTIKTLQGLLHSYQELLGESEFTFSKDIINKFAYKYPTTEIPMLMRKLYK